MAGRKSGKGRKSGGRSGYGGNAGNGQCGGKDRYGQGGGLYGDGGGRHGGGRRDARDVRAGYASGFGYGFGRRHLDSMRVMAFVMSLPLLCAGLAALFIGCALSERLARNRQRVRCERIRLQRREQHRIRKSTSTNPCPTPEALSRQWDRVHDSLDEMVRFGMLIVDLDAHVDNSLIVKRDEYGNPYIVGRMPGVKGWLAERCPHIGYKTAMRYKSLAEKARKSRKGEGFVEKCKSIYDLQESLYKDLGIIHTPPDNPREGRRVGPDPLRRPGQGRAPCQSFIYAMRSRALGALRALPSREAKRFIAAFLSLAEEVRGAP